MIDRVKVIISYIFMAIAINGFFSIYLTSDNPGTPRSLWFLLFLAGGIFVVGKTFKFDKEEQIKLALLDLLFIGILMGFAFISMPWGLNYIIGSILAVLLLYFVIDKKYLRQLN